MPTLVTGATGFLGGHLLARLSHRGEAVRALVRREADADRLRAIGVEVAMGEITDANAVRAAAAGCGRVYHLAGVVSHRRRDLPRLRAANVDGTRNLLAAVDPGARVVHVSSTAAIGLVASPGDRADELSPFPAAAARLPYAATKHAGERLALDAAAAGADVVVANPGFLLGPGDTHRVSTWPVFAYLSGRLRFTVPGGLAFADARDVAAGLIALAEGGRRGERTILASEDGNLTWERFFELVARVSGLQRRTFPLSAAAATAAARVTPWIVSPDEVRAAANWWFVSPAKAKRELDYTSRPLTETLRDTIADECEEL